MTQRLVDVLEHGEAERASILLDSSQASPMELGYDVLVDRARGVALFEPPAMIDLRLGDQFQLIDPMFVGDSLGTRLEMLDVEDWREARAGLDYFTPDTRPSSTVEDLSLRKIVPGGGG